MKFVPRVWALLNVRPEETQVVQLVLLLAALNGITRLLGYTAAYALFLDVLDAHSLPLIYIGSSIVSTLVSLLYLRLEKRYSLAQLLIGQMALLLLTLVGYGLGLGGTPNRWLIFSLPLYDGVVSALLFMAFWNLLGRIFNLQQGKRLFGLIGAAQELATIVVGCFLPLLVTVVGTVNLFWGAALTAAFALMVLLAIIRRTPTVQLLSADDEEAEAETGSGEMPAKRKWAADPYLVLIFAMYICFGLGDYFVDNIFYARVEVNFTNPEQMAGFLGVFASIVSGLSLCSHLFLSGYVLRRYGVRTIILLTPLLLAVITTLFILSGLFSASMVLLFWLAVLMNLTRQVTDAFDNTAANLLYQPLPATVRMRTQTTIDGIVYPVAGGLSGLLLYFLTNYLQLDSLQLAYVLLPLVVIWLVTTIALGRVYPRRVQQALRQRIVRGGGAFTPDRVSLEIMQQHLRSPHPGAVLYALDLLAAHDSDALHNCLPALLAHPTVQVRLAAIAQIETIGSPQLLGLLEQSLAAETDDGVRSAALRILSTLGGLAYSERLHEQLLTTNPQLRQGVMVGLLRSGELEGILAVGAQLAQLVQSPDVIERIFAAQVLGESGITSFYRPLLQLLADPAPSVRRAALAAAAKLHQPKLWPLVVEALAKPTTRSAAQSALVAGGANTLPALAAGWRVATADPAFRIALARTCGRLHSDAATALLLAALDDPDASVRSHILAALYQSGYQATPPERPRFEAAIRAELAHAAWTLAGIVDLADDAELALVRNALLASLQQQQMRLFHWLGLLYDPTIIRRVRDVLAPTLTPVAILNAEQRSYALETLDLLITADFKAQLRALYDDQAPLPKLTKVAEHTPQARLNPAARLHEIITGPAIWLTPWLQATALYNAPAVACTVPDILANALHQAVTAATTTSNALVQESAQWAVHHFPILPSIVETGRAAD